MMPGTLLCASGFLFLCARWAPSAKVNPRCRVSGRRPSEAVYCLAHENTLVDHIRSKLLYSLFLAVCMQTLPQGTSAHPACGVYAASEHFGSLYMTTACQQKQKNGTMKCGSRLQH